MTTIAAIEDEARKPKLYMRIETEDLDDITSSMIASSVGAIFAMLRLTIKNKEPCKTKVRFKETKNSVTMIIEEFCLAVTVFGHLHLTGRKIAGKPYRAIYEIRLEDQERDSAPPQRGV
jgi:predicted phosphohydrolase